MTTINSQDDFLQALVDNPEWRAAVRAQILGEELQQLPVRFDTFIQQQQAFSERIEGFIGEQRAINERLGLSIERLDRSIERIDLSIERLDRSIERIDRFIEEQRLCNEEQRLCNERIDRSIALITNRLDRIESDIGVVKGGHARTHVGEFAEIIARNLALEFVGKLTPKGLDDIARNITDATADVYQKESFINADLVIQAATDNGQTVYIAVETSWTADLRDSRRAMRNARYLNNATGNEAFAVVASVRNDHGVAELIGSGDIRWHRIPDRDLEPA